MTALAATDITLTLSQRDKDIAHRGALKNISIAALSFGDGSLTYPSGGIPLPVIGKFGYSRQVDFGSIEPDPDDGYVYKYDRANHKLRVFAQGVTTGATAAAVNENGALAVDVSGAETAVRLPNTAASTAYSLGPLHEVGTSFAPLATAMRMLLFGE